ncbi:MAG: hypothetical protein WD065_16945 [Planctomycetaceae bacterium]
MNRRLLLPAVVVSVSIGALFPAVADEPTSAALMQTLPHDGAWATYNVNVMVNDQEFIMSATARLVGQATYGGKLCRFIEYEQTVAAPPAIDVPQLGNLTWRLLVPEEEFGEGKDPLGKAVKMWVKIDQQDPEVVDSIERTDPIFATIFRGPTKNLKVEDAPEKIMWQRGTLECEVVSGQNDFQLGTFQLDIAHRVFKHPDVPFGVAGMQQGMKATFGGQEVKVSLRASLRDHGKEAKAKLPELVP